LQSYIVPVCELLLPLGLDSRVQTVLSEGNPRKQLKITSFPTHTHTHTHTHNYSSVSPLFDLTSHILSLSISIFRCFPLDYQKADAEKIHTGVFQRQEVHVCVLHSQWLELSEQDVCQGTYSNTHLKTSTIY